jgi:hypothetical protein
LPTRKTFDVLEYQKVLKEFDFLARTFLFFEEKRAAALITRKDYKFFLSSFSLSLDCYGGRRIVRSIVFCFPGGSNLSSIYWVYIYTPIYNRQKNKRSKSTGAEVEKKQRFRRGGNI